MRGYQPIGLTTEAYVFLTENTVHEPSNVCPKCGHVISRRLQSRVYDDCEIENGEGPSLREYQLKDGRTAREVVQTTLWSSGPMVFLCLEISAETKTGMAWKRAFEWTKEEMAIYD